MAEGTRYEYGLVMSPQRVEEEWLFAYPEGRQQEWFTRDRRREKPFDFGTHLKGPKHRLAELTPDEVPLLAMSLSYKQDQLSVPAGWLASNFWNRLEDGSGRVREGFWTIPPTGPESVTARRCHEDPAFRGWVSDFLRHADLGIGGLEVLPRGRGLVIDLSRPTGTTPALGGPETQSATVYEPRFLHKGERVRDLVPLSYKDESAGTQRLFCLLAPWYDVLRHGGVALVDELGASLHPLMTRRLIGLFHDPEQNKLGAQLIFTTHDTSLLSSAMFRRDQVWFTEKKNSEGATDLYSLHDFHPRNEEALEKGYLKGKYGAIPFFGGLDFHGEKR
jgi:hypothetical protein